MKDKILNVLKKPKSVVIYTLKFKIYRILPDKLFLKFCYRLYMGNKLNLKNPKTFNEKLQWLKLNDRNPQYTKLVDKYEVRSYILKL